MRNKKYMFLILLFVVITGVSYSYYALDSASGSIDDGWRVQGKKAMVIRYDDDGFEQEVSITNNGDADIFVPTRTTAEWESFKNHMPKEISPLDSHGEMVWVWKCTKGYCDNCHHDLEGKECNSYKLGDVLKDTCIEGDEAEVVCTAN